MAKWAQWTVFWLFVGAVYSFSNALAIATGLLQQPLAAQSLAQIQTASQDAMNVRFEMTEAELRARMDKAERTIDDIKPKVDVAVSDLWEIKWIARGVASAVAINLVMIFFKRRQDFIPESDAA